MILEITTDGHPALRTRGRKIAAIDEKIRTLVSDMIDTMREADGIGLAAQQVGRPLQLFVLEVPQMKDRPSRMTIDGKPVDFENLMPMAVINPEIKTFGKSHTASEGCLSFPGLRGDVSRPLAIHLQATALDGSPLEFEAEGLLARAIQHEFDHLQGILFIDRMIPEDIAELPSETRKLIRPVPR